MRLVRFNANGRTRIGAELSHNGDIVDITAVDSSIPCDMRSFLDAGDNALLAAQRYYMVVIFSGHFLKNYFGLIQVLYNWSLLNMFYVIISSKNIRGWGGVEWSFCRVKS